LIKILAINNDFVKKKNIPKLVRWFFGRVQAKIPSFFGVFPMCQQEDALAQDRPPG
jgi:hypothetical protein